MLDFESHVSPWQLETQMGKSSLSNDQKGTLISELNEKIETATRTRIKLEHDIDSQYRALEKDLPFHHNPSA